MGHDLYWHKVDWKELNRRYSSPADIDEICSAMNESDCQWLQDFDMDEDWLSLLQSWNGLLEFNDELIEGDRQLHDILSRDFPSLIACGVIWDPDQLYPKFPREVVADDAGYLIGTYSPETTKRLHEELKALDRPHLGELLDASVVFNDNEIFSDSGDFISFVNSITEAFRRTVLEERGILVFMSY